MGRRVLLLGVVPAVAVAALVSGYALSPYLTEETVTEALPAGAITGPGQDPGTADGTEWAFYAGTFVGVGDGIHDAQGDAYTVRLGDGGSILRLENFSATNGPGLRVYLAADYGAADYVSLGELKANRGNQNYEIPEGTDIDRYDKVLIWCEPFSVLFGSADLARSR